MNMEEHRSQCACTCAVRNQSQQTRQHIEPNQTDSIKAHKVTGKTTTK